MDLSHLDVDTARLILQFQSEDLKRLQKSANKGKHREGETPDSHLATKMFQAEIEAVETFISDRNMSKSMAFAVITDASAIQAATAQDQLEAEDRRLAMSLCRVTHRNTTNLPQPMPVETLSDELVNKFEALYVCNGNGTESLSGQPESSAWAASRKTELLRETVHCTACGDSFRFFDLTRGPCGHQYCSACIKELFQSCLVDESLFPPRCCRQPISADENIAILGSELVSQFKAKQIEFETPNRTYCSDPTCSAFIRPASIYHDKATCAVCGKQTCVDCKEIYHGGVCTKNPALQQVLELATTQGWQRCNKCNHLVELGHGCYHMTCICKAEFCYLCGVNWKNCACPQWDERRLLARAEQIVDRRQNAPADPGQRAAVVAGVREHLIENHDCAHVSWRKRGGGRCEECHDYMPIFTLECTQCRLRACRRCRHNRL